MKYLSTFDGLIDAFVVEAKGEQTLVRLLNTIGQGRSLLDVPNLACFDDQGRVLFTERREEEIDMDQTAIGWEHIPRDCLRHTLPVNSSRGCYYRCRFLYLSLAFSQSALPVIGGPARRTANH